MNIAFRTDASLQIGTGHVMRCLTLADALKAAGAQCHFICREHSGNLIANIRQRGFTVSVLQAATKAFSSDEIAVEAQSDYTAWLGTDWATDVEQTKAGLGATAIDWLIVDHYAIDARWEQALRSPARKLMVIDDLTDRQHDCEILLNQNCFENMQTRYTNAVPSHCVLLLGPRYALLRNEFRQLREHVKPRNGPVKNIMVFFGGVDAGNHTGCAIEALSEIDTSDFRVDVVIGAPHPFREEIEAGCLRHGFNCYVQTANMAELMAIADLAIGAGGSTSWERCCLGLPALLVAVADNQISIAKTLDFFGAGIYVGTMKTASAPIMRNRIVRLLKAQDQIRILSKKAFSLVDGLGVTRVCQAMGF